MQIFVNLCVQKNEKCLVEREAHSFCNEAFMCHCDMHSFTLVLNSSIFLDVDNLKFVADAKTTAL